MESLKEYTEHTITKENIKFANYRIPEFEEFVKGPLDETTLKDNLKKLNLDIKSLIKEYSSLISLNNHNFIELTKNLKKNPYIYYFICIIFNQISQLIEDKINNEQNNTSVINYSSIEELINKEITKESIDENLKNIINTELNTQEIKNIILEKLSPMFQLEKNILNNLNKEIGIVNMNLSIKISLIIINEILENIKHFNNIKEFKTDNKNILMENEIKLYDLILNLNKLEYLLIIIHNTYFLDADDIFNKPEDGDEWKKIKDHMVRVVIAKEDTLKKALGDLDNNLILFKTIIGKGMSSTSNVVNFWNSTSLAIGLSLNKNKNIHDSKQNDILTNLGESIIKMSRIGKNGITRFLLKKTFDKIGTRRKIYTRKEYKQITEEYIKEILINLKSGKMMDNQNSLKINNYSDFSSDEIIKNNIYLDSITKEKKSEYRKYYVSNRLIHSEQMNFPKDKKPIFSFNFFNKPNIGTKKDTIFFHIHGGGFVGTSFINHEDYLRKWVNHFKIPLFSVNYCYSPENKYPKPLDDVWQAYNWLLEHSKEELGIDPKKIIICGDSAGGNLVFALTFLTIVHNIKVPDLIIAAFPLLDTTKNKMTPSSILSLDDKYLSFETLKWLNEAYRDNYIEEDDPFLNPYKANEIILKKMPKTLFFFGTYDSIRDENIRLISKMSNISEIDFKVFEFKYYPHGLFGTAFKVFYPLPTSILYKEIEEFLSKQ